MEEEKISWVEEIEKPQIPQPEEIDKKLEDINFITTLQELEFK